MKLQLALILIISGILVLFTFQNPHPVQMQFMAWRTTSFPMIGLILVSALAGIVASAVLGLKMNMRLQRALRRLRSELDELKSKKAEPELDHEDPEF